MSTTVDFTFPIDGNWVEKVTKVKKITIRDAVIEARDRWLKLHGEGEFIFHDETKASEKSEKMRQLNVDQATSKDITDIIGNFSWCSLFCDICSKRNEKAIIEIRKPTSIYVQNPYRDSEHIIRICQICLLEWGTK